MTSFLCVFGEVFATYRQRISRPSKIDSRPELDDAFDRKAEVVDRALCVAGEKSKEGLRERPHDPPSSGYERLTAHVERGVRDGKARRVRGEGSLQGRRHLGVLHVPEMDDRAHEAVMEVVDFEAPLLVELRLVLDRNGQEDDVLRDRSQ